MKHTHNFFHCQIVNNDDYGKTLITTEVGNDYQAEDFDACLAFELLSTLQLVSEEALMEYVTLRNNYFFDNVEMLPVVEYQGKWAAPFIKAELESQNLRENPSHEVDILALCMSVEDEHLDFAWEADSSLNLMKLKYEAIYAKIQKELNVDTLFLVECPKLDDGKVDVAAPACLKIFPANYLPEEKQALDTFVQTIIRDFTFEKQPQNGNIPAHWLLTVSYNPQ